MPTTFPFAFWLTPEKQAYTQLEKYIKTISWQCSATPFAPHLTLFVGERQQDENMLKLGQKLTDEAMAIPLKLLKVDYSDFLFKTLFLQFASHPTPIKLAQTVQSALQNPGEYQFDPHLSLLYAKISQGTQQALAKSIQFDTNTFLFNKLNLVAPNSKTNDWSDIAGWQIQKTWLLPYHLQ